MKPANEFYQQDGSIKQTNSHTITSTAAKTDGNNLVAISCETFSCVNSIRVCSLSYQ